MDQTLGTNPMAREVFLDAPNIGELEKKYTNAAIDEGYISTFGHYVTDFEKECGQYIGCPYAVATQSGTAALHVALHELGIGPGDEVIVPVLTFIASVNPAIYVGAKPVFVDVNKETWTIDPQQIIKKITKKTRAIIPVHLYGNACTMDEIMAIAKKHKLYVVEDATESLGSFYKGRHTGTFGELGCFSFNGNKTITVGGGGMVVGKNQKRLKHIKFLVNQARDESQGYYHSEVGFNFRMTNLEAAVGLAQMERLPELLAKKKKFHAIYRNELKDMKGIIFPKSPSGADNTWWLTSVLFPKTNVTELQSQLKEHGIPTRRIFMPLVEFPPFKSTKKEKYPNAFYIHKHGLSLPSSTLNTEEDIHYICDVIKGLVK
jgi:perosamine synthetase